ncbi:porin [Sneathiella aquimaris]|uniref:porin n=1 Tax=Sneathiella aquimaris TaxID=2599305 RepID=UPI00146CE582|nr:porin [Sneathiella aquimaris]
MKKVILGTTALVAATALTAGSASAADKIKLGLGGYLQTSFVAADYDNDTNQLPTDIRHEGEVFFTGSTTLDNGLKFGVNIQLEARATGDQVDETFMYVSGSFGRINIGSEDSAAYLMHYSSPSPVPAWGLSSPNANASGFTTPSTLPNELGDSDKITYFTPRFSGFQFGASYTPDGDEETGSSGGVSPYAPIQDEGAEDEAYSVGVNYSAKFNTVSVQASLGYQLITRTTTDDTDEIAAGLTVGFGGFSVGGAYKYSDNDGANDDNERQDWNVGVTYGQGPWKIGVQYAGVDIDDDTPTGTNAFGAANVGDGTLHAVVLGGQYVLGPGITAFGGIQFWDGDEDTTGSEGEDATVFFVGTSLSF